MVRPHDELLVCEEVPNANPGYHRQRLEREVGVALLLDLQLVDPLTRFRDERRFEVEQEL